ncbi:MAG TPA: HlyD family type I secretion periplasmic adaptor subunit [Ramlibacter sp.]|nr:HlyD family type I secretion periplasmic adaptor subunit [Ramlibacter sp.]
MSARSLVPRHGSDLVVRQAINDFQSETAEIVGAPYPAAVRSTLYLLTGMVALALFLAAVVSLDRVVSAQGKLVSRAPTILVQPLETSVVRSILVHPGQAVKKGDLLATLDPTFTSADASQLRDQVATLTAEVGRLTAEQEARDYDPGAQPSAHEALQLSVWRYRQAELKSRLANFDQRIQSAEGLMASSQRDVTHFRSRLEVTSQIEDMRTNLERKEVGSKLNTLLAKDARTEIARNLSNAEQQARAAASDLEALKAERDAHLQQWRSAIAQELVTKQTQLQAAREELSKAERRRDLVELRAVEDATVLSIADVSVGAVAKSGDVLVSLVPADTPLEVEAEVDGADQGFVKPGDEVQVKLAAYRFIEHGTAKGVVRSISEDSFTRKDDGSTGKPFYKARIELTEVKLRNVPDDFRLVPGMPLQADIVVGSRTILMYFMEAALRQSAEGLREP